MWNAAKQRHLNTLRREELAGRLTEDQHRQLGALYAELDAEEAARLAPVIRQMDEETDRLLRQNASLEAIVESRRRLLARMHAEIDEWLSEDERLKTKAQELTGTQG